MPRCSETHSRRRSARRRYLRPRSREFQTRPLGELGGGPPALGTNAGLLASNEGAKLLRRRRTVDAGQDRSIIRSRGRRSTFGGATASLLAGSRCLAHVLSVCRTMVVANGLCCPYAPLPDSPQCRPGVAAVKVAPSGPPSAGPDGPLLTSAPSGAVWQRGPAPGSLESPQDVFPAETHTLRTGCRRPETSQDVPAVRPGPAARSTHRPT